jgi:hypothetical protein
MKKSILAFFFSLIITCVILFIDQIYFINRLYLFIILNVILFYLSIFQILNLKRKYPIIYFANPPVLCTIFTFLIPFSLSTLLINDEALAQIINFSSTNKIFFLIINSLNIMWLGYWYSDYLKEKKFYQKYFFKKIKSYVFLKYKNINFNYLIFFFLLSIMSLLIMLYLNIYGYFNDSSQMKYYENFRYLLNMALNLDYIILIVLFMLVLDNKKFSIIFTLILLLIFFFIVGLLSGFKSDFFTPYFVIFFTFYVLKKKISYIFFFISIFFLFFSYTGFVTNLRHDFQDRKSQTLEDPKKFENAIKTFSILKDSQDAFLTEYKKKIKEENFIENGLFIFKKIIFQIGSRLNQLYDASFLLTAIDFSPELLRKSDTPTFLKSILISPISAFIPRFLWSDKPKNLEGAWTTRTLINYSCEVQKKHCEYEDLYYGSTAMSSFAYLYFAGGFIFVFFFYFFIGFFQNIIFNLFKPGEFLPPTLIFIILSFKLSFIDSAIYGMITFFFREFLLLLFLQYLIFNKNK